MKRFLILFLFVLCSGHLLAQNYISYQTDIPFGESLIQDQLRLEFVEVIEDSRCPTNVTCVRAGEAKVLVAIYRENKLIEKKVLIFEASGSIDLEKNLLVSNSEIRVIGMSLSPYPLTPKKIPDMNYILELKIN
jgi:hypothetical protein